jgi:ferredoxin
MKQLKVDPERCTGDQICITIAPYVFELNDMGVAYVKDPEGADEATIQHAVNQCPSQAIYWSEE